MSDMHDNRGGSRERLTASDRADVTLMPADAAATDVLLSGESGMLADPQRQARVQQWLKLVGAARVSQPPADLVERTLQAVRAEAAQRATLRRQQEERVPPRGLSLGRQFGEFAAMALAASVLVAVLIPGIGQAREKARRVSCAANLEALSGAFGQYAAMNQGQLASLPLPDDPHERNWMPRDVSGAGASRGHSNTANLLPLVRSGLVARHRLMDPARNVTPVAFDPNQDEIPDQARGYSYVNLFGPIRPRWDGEATTVVLADRNPLFAEQAMRNPHANSLNHNRDGNNILLANGSVMWVTSPDVGPAGDNLWTIEDGVEIKWPYTGEEVPVKAGDLFLSP